MVATTNLSERDEALCNIAEIFLPEISGKDLEPDCYTNQKLFELLQADLFLALVWQTQSQPKFKSDPQAMRREVCRLAILYMRQTEEAKLENRLDAGAFVSKLYKALNELLHRRKNYNLYAICWRKLKNS